MNKHVVRVLTTVLAVAAMATGTADAGPITFNLTGSNIAGGLGNSTSQTSGGVIVTMTAWANTGAGGTFAPAQLQRWSAGMGVCGSTEGIGCGSPAHQVDNDGPDNWVLFTFSSLVDVTSVTVDPWGTYDTDVSYWVGSFTTLPGLNGASSTLAGLGFSSRYDSDGPTTANAVAHAIGGGFINALLFGPRQGGNDQDDYFKITGMAVTTLEAPSVPEPGTMVLLGSGLALLARRLRKRRQPMASR